MSDAIKGLNNNPVPENKYRVACVNDLFNASPDDVRYVYAGTLDEGRALMRRLSGRGMYQSEIGGNIPGLPNVAVLECWDESDGEWSCVVE